MPLPLLLAVIAVIGLAAVLAASGRGDRLRPEVPAQDRAPVGLPGPDERVAAEDLGKLRFALAFRGYRVDEVDAVLDRLGAELAARDARIAELEGPVGGTVPDEHVAAAETGS